MPGGRTVGGPNGRELSALDLQREYRAAATAYVDREGAHDPDHKTVLDLWERTLDAIESGNHSLVDPELDEDIDELIDLLEVEDLLAR